MKRAILAVMVTGALSACGGDGTNPFDDPVKVTDPGTGETEELSPLDPNTSADSKFLFDPENRLTMNSVEYDAANDQLVINNLPFDGPDGHYDRYGNHNGADFYASQQTATTGQIQHYAVYVKSGDMAAFAAAGADWVDVGYGGANVRRESFAFPGGVGEYVYLGTYAGLRTYDGGTGLDLVTGDARLLLDILDFDPQGGIQGAITGRITNRDLARADGSGNETWAAGELPDLILNTVSFNSDDGTFDGGTVTTAPDTTATDPASGGSEDNLPVDGSYSGMIGGASGENLGITMVIDRIPGEREIGVIVGDQQ